MEKQKIEIKDVPYLYIDETLLQGTLEEVSNNILGLKYKLDEAYKTREKDVANAYRKDLTPNFTPFDSYKYIYLKVDKDWDGDIEYGIKVYRDETDEELQKRLYINKKKSEAAKKSAQSRKLAQEKRERTMLENLKKKYE